MVLDGGAGIAGDVHIGGNVIVTGSGSSIPGVAASGVANNFTTPIVTTDTTASTSPSTGAAVVPGGAGIGGAANIGGPVRVYSTTPSTSKTTGAVIIDGGAGINGVVYCNALVTTVPLVGTLYTSGNLNYVGNNATVDGPVVGGFGGSGLGYSTGAGPSAYTSVIRVYKTANKTEMAQQTYFLNTTDATSATTGSLCSAGGISSQKTIYAGSGFRSLEGPFTMKSTTPVLNIYSIASGQCGFITVTCALGAGSAMAFFQYVSGATNASVTTLTQTGTIAFNFTLTG